jgi:hypothetical protein
VFKNEPGFLEDLDAMSYRVYLADHVAFAVDDLQWRLARLAR